MTDPADDPTAPAPPAVDGSDAELLAVRILDPVGYRASTELPDAIEWQLPVIQVTEVPGGAQVQPTLDTAVIDYDVYAGDRTTAKRVAGAARRLLLDSAGFMHDAGDGIRMWVSRTSEQRRPTLLPYDDASDVRRFGGSVRLTIRYTIPPP